MNLLQRQMLSIFFTKAYLPYEEELEKRCFFVLDSSGLPISTATAWFAMSGFGYQASLHWVAACPEYQGLGLGKAIVLSALHSFSNLEPEKDIWLHTQTWSYKAVQLYHGLGFNLMKTDKLANMNTRDGTLKIYPNDYHEAIPILKNVLSELVLSELINAAV